MVDNVINDIVIYTSVKYNKASSVARFVVLICFTYSAEVFLLAKPNFLPIHTSRIIETRIAKKLEPASGYCALINAE